MGENGFVGVEFESGKGKGRRIWCVGMVKVIDNEIRESFDTVVNGFE
ncbi:hypothetical protein [Staphylococcus epidermidis]|nr:hypothetical protein [Staphylococcus epidermidis]